MSIMDRLTKKSPAKAAAPKEKAKKTVAKTDDTSVTTNPIITKTAHNVLVRPVVTEKAAVGQSANKYTFVVAAWAKKGQVKAAIKEMYGVEPVSVNVLNVEGHRIRFGRNAGKKSDFKKAVVTLPEGKTITIHAGV